MCWCPGQRPQPLSAGQPGLRYSQPERFHHEGFVGEGACKVAYGDKVFLSLARKVACAWQDTSFQLMFQDFHVA